MSKTVDTHILEMQLDHKKFEEDVASSLKTIEKLMTALEFKGAGDGFGDITKAADKVSFASLSEQVANISTKFEGLHTVTGKVFDKIKEEMADTVMKVKGFIDSVTFDQVTAGFNKYSEKTKSVQTIMAATAGDWDDTEAQMEYVTQQMSKLNWFTDETSYNFLDMTNNIGKFTNNGVKLDDAVTAMEGVSTWAGISGATIEEAGRAMYNLSQAMGIGKVTLQDWKSIENANMATAEFKEMALQVAAAKGTLEDLGNGQYNNGEAIISIKNFTKEMTKSGWFTADVLTDVLKNYGNFTDELYNLSEKVNGEDSDVYYTTSELIRLVDAYKSGRYDLSELAEETGLNVDDIKQSFDKLGSAEMDLGRRAFAASQEATTFQQAIDSVKDATSTGWMNVFENIFGNYQEAKELWTDVANELYDVFAEPLNELNSLLKKWKKLGGRDDFIDALWEMWDIIKEVGGSIAAAFDNFIPDINAKDLRNYTREFKNFVTGIKPTQNTLSKITEIVSGILAAIKLVGDVAGQFMSAVAPVFEGVIAPIFKGALDFAGGLGTFVTNFEKYVDKTQVIKKTLENIGDWFASKIPPEFKAFLFGEKKERTSYIVDDLGNIVEKIEEYTSGGVLRKIKFFFEGLSDSLRDFDFETSIDNFHSVIDALKEIAKGMVDFVKNIDVPFFGTLGDLFDTISEKVEKFFLKGGIFDVFTKIKEFLFGGKVVGTSPIIDQTTGAIDGWEDVLSKDLFGRIGDAIKDFATKLTGANELIPSDLKEKFSGIKDTITNFISEIKLPTLEDVGDVFKGFAEKLKEFLFGKTETTPTIDKFTEIIDGWETTFKTGIIGKIQSSLGNLKESISSFIEDIDMPTLEEMLGYMSKIKEKFKEFLFGGESEVSPIIDQTTGAISGWEYITKEGIFEKIGDGFLTLKDKLMQFVDGLDLPSINDIGDGLINFKDKIKDFLFGTGTTTTSPIIDETTGIIESWEVIEDKGFLGKLAKTFKNLKESIQSFIKNIKLPSMEDIGEGFGKLKDKLVDVANKIKPYLPTWDDISTTIGKIKDGVVNFVKDLKPLLPSWDTVLGFFVGLKEKIKDVAEVVKPYLPTWDDILGFIKKIPEFIGEVISNFSITAYADEIEGSGDGSVSQSVEMLEKVKDFLSQAWDVISQIFRIVGNIGGTILKGLEEVTQNATFEDYANGIHTAFTTGVDLYKTASIFGTIKSVGTGVKTVGDAMKIFASNTKSVTGGITGLLDSTNKGVKGMFGGIDNLMNTIKGFVENKQKNENRTSFAETLKEFGKAMLEIGGAIGIIAGSVWVIGQLDPMEVDQALGTLTGIAIGMGGLITAFTLIPTAAITFKEMGKAFLEFSAAIAILAADIWIYKNMDWDTVLDGCSKMLPILAELSLAQIAVSKFGGDNEGSWKGTLSLAIGLYAIASVVKKFGELDWEVLVQGVIGSGAVLTELVTANVILSKFGATDGTVWKSVLSFAAYLWVMCESVERLGKMDMDVLIQGLIATGAVLAELVAVTVIIKKFGGSEGLGIHLLTVLAMGLLLEEIKSVFVTLATIPTEQLAVIAASIGGVFLSLSGSIAILAGISVTGAISALGSLFTFIGLGAANTTGLALLFNWLEKLSDGTFKEKIQNGIDVLKAITTGLGEVIGGFVGGFLSEITTLLLPAIGTALSGFMGNLSGFIDGVKNIPDNIAERMGYLATAVLTFTKADFLAGLTNLISNGMSNLPQVGKALSEFAKNLLPFAGYSLIITDKVVDLASNLSDLVLKITAQNLIDNILNFLGALTGPKALEQFLGLSSPMQRFGSEIVIMGKALKAFGDEVKGIDSGAVANATTAGELLAALEEKLPDAGLSLKTFVFGEKKWSTISTGLADFGTAMKNFSAAVTEGEGIDQTAITGAAKAGGLLAELENKLPASGNNLKTFLVGERDWSTIWVGLKAFGTAMKEFSDAITANGGLDTTAINNAAKAGGVLAELENKLPALGGIKTFILGGKSWDTISSGLVEFGTAMKEFSDAITGEDGINADAITDTANAAKVLAELENSLPSTGGIIDFFIGHKQDLSDFADGINSLSTALVGYANIQDEVSLEAVTSVTEAIEKILGLQDYMTDTGGFGFSYVLGQMVDEVNQEGPKLVAALANIFVNTDETTGLNAFQRIQNGTTEALKGMRVAMDEFFGSSANGSESVGIQAEFANNFENMIAVLASKATGLKESADDFFGAIADALTEAFGTGETTTGITGSFLSHVDGLYNNTTWQTKIEGMRSATGALFTAIQTAMNEKFGAPGIATGITATFTSKIDGLIEIVASKNETMLATAESFFETFNSAMNNKVESINNLETWILYKMIQNVTNNTPGMLTKAGIFVNTFNVAMSEKKDSIYNLENWILSTMLQNVATNTPGMLAKTTSFVNMFNLAMSNKKDSIFNYENWILSSMVTNVGNTTPTMLDKSETLANAIASGLINKNQTIIEAMGGVLTNVITTINEKYSDFSSAGSYSAQGFASGLNSKVNSAIDAARTLVKNTVEELKKKLEINSPSKVTEEIGMYTVLGLAEGLLNNAGEATSAASIATDQLIEAMRQPVDQMLAVLSEDFNEPVIRPVLDLTGVESGAESVNDIFSNRFGLDFADFGSALPDEIETKDGGIIAELSQLRADVNNLNDRLAKMRVVLDTGETVGGLLYETDRQLGRLEMLRERGN